jgi:hypothetical protein
VTAGRQVGAQQRIHTNASVDAASEPQTCSRYQAGKPKRGSIGLRLRARTVALPASRRGALGSLAKTPHWDRMRLPWALSIIVTLASRKPVVIGAK